MFFNEDSNISPMILQSYVEHTLGEKIIIPQDKYFLFKCPTLHISKINSILDFKQKTTREQKLWSTSCKGKLHGLMAYEIHMFIQLWNSFPEELKTKQKIIYTYVMEDLFMKKK